MGRLSFAAAETRAEVTDQIAIGLRAYNEARRASDPVQKIHLFDFAMSHLASAVAKISEQKRAVQ